MRAVCVLCVLCIVRAACVDVLMCRCVGVLCYCVGPTVFTVCAVCTVYTVFICTVYSACSMCCCVVVLQHQSTLYAYMYCSSFLDPPLFLAVSLPSTAIQRPGDLRSEQVDVRGKPHPRRCLQAADAVRGGGEARVHQRHTPRGDGTGGGW